MTVAIDLSGQVAVVTGAGRGIGRAAARMLADAGAHAVIVDMDGEAAEDAAAEVTGPGASAEAALADVTDESQVRRLFAGVFERHGRIDVLVNAVGGGRPVPFLEITGGEWDRMFDLNVRQCFLCSREAARYMARGGGGRIVNVISLAGLKTSVLQGAHYTAAKSAVVGLTRHLAVELAPLGILVNGIAPGVTATERIEKQMTPERRQSVLSRIPLGRIATPQDQAGVILFLVSPLAGYVTGTVIDVSGGYLLA